MSEEKWWRCRDCGETTQTDPALWRSPCRVSTFHDNVEEAPGMVDLMGRLGQSLRAARDLNDR